MSMFDLPDNYVFTEQDVEAHWELFRKEMQENVTLSDEEEEFYYVVNQADRLRCEIKRLPSMGELRQYLHEEAKKEEQKRINSWSETYTLREKDFTEEAEPGGPLAQFISVAKTLKTKLGRMPCVKEVRESLQ